MGISRKHIEREQVNTEHIADDAVTSSKIKDNAVTNTKIANDAVTSSKIKKSFESESTVSVDAGGTYTIPAGIYLVSLGANTACEYTPDGGTTWRTLIAAGGGGVVISDGENVRLNNSGTAAEDSYLMPLG